MGVKGRLKIGAIALAVLAAAAGAVLVYNSGDEAAARGAAENPAASDRAPLAADRAPLTAASQRSADAIDATMTIWKTPTCLCCTAWVDHVREAGFEVEVHDISERQLIDVKHRHGIGPHLSSCHTAVVEGYAIEGHVPAADVQRLLAERPDVRGIAVPGMPIGSPGMEIGDRRDPYDVVTFDEDGSTRVFSSHR